MNQRKSGFYDMPSGRVRWKVMVDGVRYSGTADTLGDARRQRAQAQISAGATPTGDPTVAEVVDAYMSDLKCAHGTRDQLRRAEKTLPPAFLTRQATSVTPAVVAALWRELADRESPHTVNRCRDLLSKAWRLAITWEWVSSNPFKLVPAPSAPTAREVDPPSPEQVRKILAAAGDRDLALFLRLAALTGARRGELCGLQWRDFRFDAHEVVVRRAVSETETQGLVIGEGKTGRGGHRVIPLDDATIEACQQHDRIVGCPWLFSHDGVNPWRPGYTTHEFTRLARNAKVKGVRLHGLRHFAATQWLAAGVPVPTVAHLLGHTNPATTLRVYSHFIPAQAREAITAHGALLDGY